MQRGNVAGILISEWHCGAQSIGPASDQSSCPLFPTARTGHRVRGQAIPHSHSQEMGSPRWGWSCFHDRGVQQGQHPPRRSAAPTRRRGKENRLTCWQRDATAHATAQQMGAAQVSPSPRSPHTTVPTCDTVQHIGRRRTPGCVWFQQIIHKRTAIPCSRALCAPVLEWPLTAVLFL
jgi:hypothetical protein